MFAIMYADDTCFLINGTDNTMRSMSLCDMQISKSKKNSCPPPPKSWGRP